MKEFNEETTWFLYVGYFGDKIDGFGRIGIVKSEETDYFKGKGSWVLQGAEKTGTKIEFIDLWEKDFVQISFLYDEVAVDAQLLN